MFNKKEVVLSLTDWHIPFEDKKALKVVFKFCEQEQPDIIVIHEILDCYKVSKFEKDPNRLYLLQDEIDIAIKYLKELRRVCPNSRIISLDSNHTDRIKKYLWRDAPSLASLRSLKLYELLELDKLDIEHREEFEHKGVLFKHGNRVTQYSALTARNEFLKELMSCVTGHTHRLGHYYITKRGGNFDGIECGCLCELNPDYIDGTPDWQLGFGVIEFYKKYNIKHAVPIKDYKIHWNGEITR